ncbi:MAG: Crp/Fnr family transcriptional regulator [Bacteroidota bacterium]
MYRDIIYNKYHFKSDYLFEGLSKDEKVILESHMVTHIYQKGQVIFRRGAAPSGVFVLNKGKVKKYTIGSDGKQHIFYICSSGEVLGYHALLSEETYPDFAQTLEDSTISFIPREDFINVLELSKTLNKKLLKNLSHEFTVFINSTTVLAQKTVRERLALALLMLKEKYQKDRSNDDSIEIVMSRDDMANIVGTATETLVRLLHDFKEDRVIETQGRSIKILNLAMLVKIANFY